MLSLQIWKLLSSCFFPLLVCSTKRKFCFHVKSICTKLSIIRIDFLVGIIFFVNSTLYSSNTAANATKTLTASNIYSFDDACQASLDAFRNSQYEFYQSASAAGLFSTSILGTGMQTVTFTDYSLVIYTSRDGQDEHSYVSSKVPTSIRITSWPVTLETVRTPTYPGSSPTCNMDYYCGSNCTIRAREVQLIYWPVNTISGYSNLTVAPNATEPVTAMINGTTFTSPTVYLSYNGVSAVDNCESPIARSYPGAVLSLHPNNVSSIHGLHGGSTRFDFADLNKPYPLRVLFSMCWPTPIESCILDPTKEYNPRLVVPEEIRTLDPAWKTCDPDFFGSYDPPRILVPAHALVSSTAAVDAEATSSTPMPAPVHTAPGAVSTSKPSTNDPPANDPPDKSSAAKDPPTISPPVNDLSVKDPPARSPSTVDLYVNIPPTKDPSTQNPFTNNSPVKDPPTKTPHADDPPAKDSLAKEPPKASSPVRTSVSDDFSVISRSQTLTTNSVDRPDIFTQTLENYEINVSNTLIPTGLQTSFPIDRSAFLGTSISAPPSPLAPFVGSDTKVVYPTFALPHLTIASQTYTANSASRYIIASQTLTPDGQIIVSGTPISLHPSASAVVIGSTTKTLPATFALPPLTIGVQTFSANSKSAYIVHDQTLTKGGQITVAGTPISLAVETSNPPAEGPTHRLPPTAIPTPLGTVPPQTHAIEPASSDIIIISHHQTLTPGGVITVHGIPISLAPQSSILFIGTSPQNSEGGSSAWGLGHWIMEGLRGGGGGGGNDGDDSGSEHGTSNRTTRHDNTATSSARASAHAPDEGSASSPLVSSADSTCTPLIAAAARRKDQPRLGIFAVRGILMFWLLL